MKQIGWKALDLAPAKSKKAGPGAAADDGRGEQELPPGLSQGQPQDVLDAEVLKKKTRAPKLLVVRRRCLSQGGLFMPSAPFPVVADNEEIAQMVTLVLAAHQGNQVKAKDAAR